MSTRFHRRVQRILEAVSQAEPDWRESLIQEACEGDPKLLEEVRSLLPHYETAGEFKPGRPLGSAWGLPGTTTFTRAADAAADEPEWTPPFAIAPYTVVKVLGRGGMGVVYRAVNPATHRVVAIKVLRKRLRSREDRRRFMFEEEILRQLQHTGIGRFLHGGIARIVHRNTPQAPPDRRPYFVMEYIAGQSLTAFAREHELDVRARLALLAKVCEALEHAHRRGIIHRDLKPDNILVEESGQPKVLDFGIAQILEFESTLIRNEDGQFAGTREYASPEQMAGRVKDLTPASDVYTLGLIAHELLTGRLPPRKGGKVRLRLADVVLEESAAAWQHQRRVPLLPVSDPGDGGAPDARRAVRHRGRAGSRYRESAESLSRRLELDEAHRPLVATRLAALAGGVRRVQQAAECGAAQAHRTSRRERGLPLLDAGVI